MGALKHESDARPAGHEERRRATGRRAVVQAQRPEEEDGRDRRGGDGPDHLPVHTVPALFSTGTPTAFPYSVQDPS